MDGDPKLGARDLRLRFAKAALERTRALRSKDYAAMPLYDLTKPAKSAKLMPKKG